MRNERELLADCLQRLNGLDVGYMLVGSMASNYWGIPRSTHDLDFVLALRRDDVDRFVQVFEDGFFVQREAVRGALLPPHQFNVLDDASALKAHFWLLGDDPFERSAFQRRLPVRLFDVPAWVATAEDVIVHKLYWQAITPSDRQLLDAAGVYAVQGPLLDLPYMRRWAAVLGVGPQLEKLIDGGTSPKTS